MSAFTNWFFLFLYSYFVIFLLLNAKVIIFVFIFYVAFLAKILFIYLFIFIFWCGEPSPFHIAHGILVPRPGIKPTSPELEMWCLNHWTAREVPLSIL